MSEEATKHSFERHSETAPQDENTSQRKLLDEFMLKPSVLSTKPTFQTETGTTLSIPPLDRTDCFPHPHPDPLPEPLPWPHRLPPVENPTVGDRKPYIPSPSEIAPIMLPGFFENYPKSPELDRVGASADKLAQLMKDGASPEDQKNAWEAFQKDAKDVPGNLAALRLELSLYQQNVPGALGVEYNAYNKQLSVIDYGRYEHMGNIPYNAPDVKTLDFNAGDKPEAKQAVADFAEQLQKGVTTPELEKMLPDLLGKLSKMGLDASTASSAIYWGLVHAPGNQYSDLGDTGPVYMLDGKPVHLNTSAMFFDKQVEFGFTPQSKKIFG